MLRSFTNTFSQELLVAARKYAGAPAIYHQQFAGNCLEGVTDNCFDNGLGPAFDCSGFVLRAYADVTGWQTGQFGNLRHVRDIWGAAQDNQSPFTKGEFAVGNLVVTARTYTINGEQVTFPGHIGIVTDTLTPRFIHANPRAGCVRERSLRAQIALMGYVTLGRS